MVNSNPEEIFRRHGGQLRMSEAISHGISRYTIYTLRDRGVIEQITRGIYRIVEMPPMSNPDLQIVTLRYPKAVICLISALYFHQITTQIPYKVWVAIPRGARLPILEFPPIRAFKFSHETYKSEAHVHWIDGVAVKIYSREKTLADCFKFRNKIGMDVALEALKFYVEDYETMNLSKLIECARICRVERIMSPYLETLL